MDTNITVKLVPSQLTRDNAPASAFAELLQNNEILAAEVRCDIVRTYDGVDKVVAKNQLPDSDAIIRNAIETAVGCPIRVIHGSKAYAEAGIVCFVKEQNKFSWPVELDTVKALGVLGQPGTKFETTLAHFSVVDKAFDGAIEVTRECLNRILTAANKPLVATAVKIAGEQGLKAVLFARDGGCTTMVGKIEQGNFKGGKPVVGTIVDNLIGRVVLTDIEYRNCGTWLSYQVLDQLKNGPELVKARLAPVEANIKIVADGLNGDRSWNATAVFAAMDLVNIKSAINDEQSQPQLPSDWEDTVSTAQFLLETGISPTKSPRLAYSLETILAVRKRDCLKGIPLTKKEMVSGLAIPDNEVPVGEILVGAELECAFKKAYIFRYPAAAPDNIATVKVVIVPGRQIRINPLAWKDSDFDGDVMYAIDAEIGELRPVLGIVHSDKTAGKVEVGILEEVRQLHHASKLIGRVELLREYIDNLSTVKNICLDGLLRKAVVVYNDSLQAKNRDVSVREDVNSILKQLKEMGYESVVHPARFKGLKKVELTRHGFNDMVNHCRTFRKDPQGWEATCRGQAAMVLAYSNVVLKDAALIRDEFYSRATRIVPKDAPMESYKVWAVLEGVYHNDVKSGKDTGAMDFKVTREWIKKISTEDSIELPNKDTVAMTPEIREVIAYFAANKIAKSNTMSSMLFDHFRQTKLARFLYGACNDIPDTCEECKQQVAIVPTETK